MSDYLKGVIYKLHKDDMTEIYIGSTADEKHREKCHKSDCNNENSEEYNRKVYKFIRDNGGWDTWTFEVIERFPCENDIQLRIREQYYYDLMKPILNSQRPYISEEERKEEQAKRSAKHYLDNIEELKKYGRNYSAKNYKDNKDEILKRGKQKHICDCGKEYTDGHKARHCDSNKHKKYLENLNK